MFLTQKGALSVLSARPGKIGRRHAKLAEVRAVIAQKLSQRQSLPWDVEGLVFKSYAWGSRRQRQRAQIVISKSQVYGNLSG